MSLGTILLILLILILIGGLPSFGVAPAGWGYYPSGVAGVLLVIVIVLLLLRIL